MSTMKPFALPNLRCLYCLIAVISTTLTLSACSRADESAPTRAVAAQAPAEAERDAPAGAVAGGAAADRQGRPASTPDRAPRKLIRNGELSIEVDAYPEARKAIDRTLERVGGFVGDAHIQHRDGVVSHAELTLRVPSLRLEEAIVALAKTGKVLDENVTSRDITGEYYDAQARLKTARQLEARLLGLVQAKTNTVKDLLEVEKELGRVRTEIETIEGRVRMYDGQVSLSTLVVRLSTRDVFAAGPPLALGERVARTFSGSLDAMSTLGQALVLLAVAVAPWLPLLLLLGFVGYRVLRWLLGRTHPRFA